MLSEATTRWVMPPLGGWHNVAGIVLAVLFLLYLRRSHSSEDSTGAPPQLGERIPFLSNSIQLATDTEAFWNRALRTMRSLNTEILRFRLGWRRVYLVVGENKTNPLFRVNTGLTSHYIITLFTDVMFGPTEKDAARLAADVSGRGKEPIPGTEHVEDRLWTKWHHIFAENLMRTQPTNDLAAWFFTRFIARTNDRFPLDKPTDVLIWKFLQRHQTECAARAFIGDLIFDTNPDYLDSLAEYELAIMPVALGPPRWLNPNPHRARDRWLDINRRYFASALPSYDWDSAPKNGWDPVLGSPLIRSLARWGLDAGFTVQTIAGMCGQQVSNQNSNSVPAAAWSLMGALTCPDPALLPNLRREAKAAVTGGQQPFFDLQKLLNSPWLQAVYTETLRLRVVFSIVRDAERDTEIDGFAIPRGAIVQAPIPLAHRHSAAWGDAEGRHPPDEFWPGRHLSPKTGPKSGEDDKGGDMEFAVGGGSGSQTSGYWFPYGGGITMCPGRHFAKQEIIGTLALFLVRFDIEVVGWVMPDETPSDREAQNGKSFAVCRPDRDLKVRITRRRD